MATQPQGKSPWACGDCGTTTTPVRRSGPDGPSTLCNACGLRLAKRIKDAGGLSIRARKKLAVADGIVKNRKRPVKRKNTDSVTGSGGETNNQIHHTETLNHQSHVIAEKEKTNVLQGKTRLEIEREELARRRKEEHAVVLEKANGLRQKMEQARERDLQRNPLLKNPRTMTSEDHWERASWLRQIRQQMAANWPTIPSTNAKCTVNSMHASSSPLTTLTGENSSQSKNCVRSDVIEALAKEAKKGAWTKLNYPLGTNLLSLTTMQTNDHQKSAHLLRKQGALDNTSQGMSSTTGGGSFSSDPIVEDTHLPTYNSMEISSQKSHVSSSDDNQQQTCQRSQCGDLTRRLDAIQAVSTSLLKGCDLLLAQNREMKANIANDRRAIMALSVDARKIADQFKRTPGT